MAERDVWAQLVFFWRRENWLGKLERYETRHKSGIPDVTLCRHGVTHYIELKHCPRTFDKQTPAMFPYGLTGAQALHLDDRAIAGAPSWLLVGFGEISRARSGEGASFALWSAGKLKSFFDDDVRANPPSPDLVLPGTFNWRFYLASQRRFFAAPFLD